MYLHVIPHSGLANRLRALASGLWVADDAKVPLVVSWAADYMTPVPFEALFTNRLNQDTACPLPCRLSGSRTRRPSTSGWTRATVSSRSGPARHSATGPTCAHTPPP